MLFDVAEPGPMAPWQVLQLLMLELGMLVR